MAEPNNNGSNGDLKQKEPIMDSVARGIPTEEKSKDEIKQKPKDVVMTITMQSNGILGVDGPGDGKLYNMPICLWMLELAKDHIKFSNKVAMQSKLVKPNMISRVKGAFGGR